VHADHVQEAGGTTTQELAFATAEALEKLVSVMGQGKSIADAPTTVFVFAVGSNYFLEIAKFRAARLMWSAVISAFGCDDLHTASVRIHARTARVNKSVLDSYTNLLRVTTEAMSAVIGGCDSLSVEPFGFDDHLALNVHRILREEAHLARVADPAGGSYYIEALTDALARDAWKLFQKIESLGGWRAAVQSEFVEQEITRAREAKLKATALRRRTMVGVNNYPNSAERVCFDSPANNNEFRLAEPFEYIRARMERHVNSGGKRPKVLLLMRGDLNMRMARANFCLNFFGCGGFALAESEEYADSDADLIVLCSSDGDYVPLAREVCKAAAVPVVVGGNPKEHIAELESLGVAGFVHILSNAVETLTYWQDRLGVDQ
jgi:methylmalonyl-CoA mutase